MCQKLVLPICVLPTGLEDENNSNVDTEGTTESNVSNVEDEVDQDAMGKRQDPQSDVEMDEGSGDDVSERHQLNLLILKALLRLLSRI